MTDELYNPPAGIHPSPLYRLPDTDSSQLVPSVDTGDPGDVLAIPPDGGDPEWTTLVPISTATQTNVRLSHSSDPTIQNNEDLIATWTRINTLVMLTIQPSTGFTINWDSPNDTISAANFNYSNGTTSNWTMPTGFRPPQNTITTCAAGAIDVTGVDGQLPIYLEMTRATGASCLFNLKARDVDQTISPAQTFSIPIFTVYYVGE